MAKTQIRDSLRDEALDPVKILNNHQLKLVGLIYGLEVRIRVA
jgi:hypothetical protein